MKKPDILGPPILWFIAGRCDHLLLNSNRCRKDEEIYQMSALRDKGDKIQAVAEQEAEMKLTSSFQYGLNHLVQ